MSRIFDIRRSASEKESTDYTAAMLANNHAVLCSYNEAEAKEEELLRTETYVEEIILRNHVEHMSKPLKPTM